MKVLFIPAWYPSPGGSGVSGSFVREHALAAAMRHEVAVLNMVNDGRGIPALRVERCEDGPLLLFTARIRDSAVPHTNAPFLRALMMKAAGRVFDEVGHPDLLHAQDTSSIFTLRLSGATGVPFVISQHWGAFMRRMIPRKLARRLRKPFEEARAVMPVYGGASPDYEHYGIRARVIPVPNCFDPMVFHPGSGPRKPWLLHASGFTPQKRVEDILSAFRATRERNPEAMLILAGDGPSRERLEALAADVLPEGSCEFRGFLAKQELADLMRTCCGFVFPSTHETFGCALMEAMACGCPALTTSVGGIPEVAREGECLRVEPGDVKGITEGMCALLGGSHGLDTAAVAREVERRFSREAVSQLLTEVYELSTGLHGSAS